MSEPFVLKDYFATMMLKEMTARNPELVFKGGTCLSKCYGAINRFSEDVDLGLPYEHSTEGMRKRIKQAVVASAKAMDLKITNLEGTRSRRDYNRYDILLGKTQDSLIVETAIMTPACPFKMKSLQSFVGQFTDEQERYELTRRYSLEAFEVRANSLERTFADKVFALCDYYLVEESIPPRQSRHIYDLYKLLDLVTLDQDLLDLMSDVRKQREGSYRCPSAKQGVNLSELLETISENEAYRFDYTNVTFPLLYEDIPYDEAATSLTTIGSFLRTSPTS